MNYESGKMPDSGLALFEPMSLAENKMVYDVLTTIYNNTFAHITPHIPYIEPWIGVDDLDNDGSFTYTGSGLAILFNIPWYKFTFNRKPGPYYCVAITLDSKWVNAGCLLSLPSTCQPDV